MKHKTIILAAGKGTRMKSELPKVIHKLAGKPMIEHVVKTAKAAGSQEVIVVVGHMAEMVQEVLGDSVKYALQNEQKGTAHAVKMTEENLRNFDGIALVLAGDVPLIRKETIENILKLHEEQKAAATVLTVKQENPFGYGRIIRDREGNVLRIVEEKDANESEKAVKEVNSGTYCFDSNLLFEAINEVKSENVQGEYYLTDVLEILKNKGQKVSAFMTENPMEVMGVNTIEALKVLEDILLKNK